MEERRKSGEPLVRMVKRDAIPWWKAWGIRIIALALSLVVCALFIKAVTALNALEVYKSMARGAFGSNKRTWITFRDVAMLLCVSLGLAPAFMMKFWNIGAEGQILVGGIATAACMIYFGGTLPSWLLFIVMIATSIAAGALWGFLPAFFKSKWKTNETLFTLMMNYVAIQLTSYCVALWENPYGSNTVGVINPETKAGWFPSVLGQQYGLNIIIVLTLTVVMFFYLKYSKHGYEISVVGDSENTARYAGMNVKKIVMRTMVLSGAICGFSGFLAVAGASHTISTKTAGGRGFTAIIVAWLSNFNSFVMIFFSFLIVFLEKGASQIASDFNLNDEASKIMKGIILFFVLGSEFFINYRLVFRGKHKQEVKC